MGIRDLILLAAFFAVLPLCFMRPYAGVLVWSVFAYLNPHRMTWGVGWSFPFAQLTAIVTCVGLLVWLSKPRTRSLLPPVRETYLMLALWVMFTASAIFAIDPDNSWPAWSKMSKILLMTVVTLMLVDTTAKLRWLTIIIALSIGYYGFKGAVRFVLSGGTAMIMGPERSSIADNTSIGLALNMVLPMLYYLGRSARPRILKALFYGTFALSIVAIVGTYSRGALLGLVAVLGLLVVQSGFKLKIAVATAIFLAGPVVLTMLPDTWVNKMQSIQTYQEDGSAMSRLQAWKTAWRIGLDRPLVGGGFNIVNDADIYLKYNPGVSLQKSKEGYVTGVHSSYFEIIGENGFVAFALYLSLIIASYFGARGVTRRQRRNGDPELANFGRMYQGAILGYAVSGAFLEYGDFDLFYHIVALVACLKAVAANPHVKPIALARDVPIWNAPRADPGRTGAR